MFGNTSAHKNEYVSFDAVNPTTESYKEKPKENKTLCADTYGAVIATKRKQAKC